MKIKIKIKIRNCKTLIQNTCLERINIKFVLIQNENRYQKLFQNSTQEDLDHIYKSIPALKSTSSLIIKINKNIFPSKKKQEYINETKFDFYKKNHCQSITNLNNIQ